MTFIVMITLPVLDIAYTVGNMQVCLSFDGNSQALAGSIFGVATRVRNLKLKRISTDILTSALQLGTSIGLAVSSSVANSVSRKFNEMPEHTSLSATDPEVLMIGFRAAGWVCVGALVIAIVVAVFGLRGIGLVGQQGLEEKRISVIELGRISNVGTTPRDVEVGDVSDLDTVTLARFDIGSAQHLDSDSRTQVNVEVPEKDGKSDFGGASAV